MFAPIAVALALAAAPQPLPSPRSDFRTAAEAREAIDNEVKAMTQGGQRLPPGYSRPWHELSWLYTPAKGRVGRLHDYCMGTVEPMPRLSVGVWDWDTLDPRTLSPTERERVKNWRLQMLASGFACGTVFEIGSTGHDARKRFTVCKARPAEAFTAYVGRRPELRAREDILEVTVEALRDAGCS